MKNKTVAGWVVFSAYILAMAWVSRSRIINRSPIAFPAILIAVSAMLIYALQSIKMPDNVAEDLAE